MANKKISELAVRTPSLTDLMLVGDPSTGYSYKATISSLSTLLEANIALDDLNDVTITSPTAGQVLSYNGTAWVNDTNGITGTGTTNYVPKFTSSSAIGNSQIFDNGTNVGIGTATPDSTSRVEISKTDGYGLYINYTTNTGVAPTASALWTLNNTNLFGYSAIIEEKTPNSGSLQIPLLIKHSLSSGTAQAGNGTGIHFDIPDDAGTFKRMQLSVEATDTAAATYSSRFRFNVRHNNVGTNVLYIAGNGVGIFQNTPAASLDVNGDLKVSTIANATTDTDKFIVSDGGVIKYRTGSEVLSDIGGAAASSISGTTNYIPKFTSSSAIGNSQIFDNGTSIGINTITPSASYKLDVNGDIRATSFYVPSTTNGGGFIFDAGGNSGLSIGQSGQVLQFYTNGSERMRLDASGNLGLGTSSPAYKLDVNGIARINATTSTPLIVESNQSATFIGLKDASGSFTYLGSDDGAFLVQTPSGGYSTKLTLDNSGNLGLGVTPSAWSNFRVIQGVGTSGNSAIAFNNSGGLDLVYNTFYNGTNFIYLTTGNLANRYTIEAGTYKWYTAPSGTAGNAISFTQAMTLDASGNLMVATTSPALTSAGRGNITIGGSTSILNFAPTTGSGYIFYTGTDMYLFNDANGILSFGTNSTERMRITSGGNLLVGTNTDVSGVGKFVLYYGSDANYGIVLNNTYTATSNNGYFNRYYNNGTEIATFYANNAAGSLFNIVGKDGLTFATGGVPTGSERMRITSGGNVGIGNTNPNSYYVNANNLVIGNTTASNGMTIASINSGFGAFYFADGTTGSEQYRGFIEYGHTNDYMSIGTAGSERMRITSGGNVGIGTSNPTNKLEVVGGRTYIQTGNEIYTLGISRSGANAYYLGISNSISPDLYFSNNAGTTRVTFTDGGNVGIGTTSPVTNLQVHKPTTGLSGVQVTNSTTGSSISDGLFLGIDDSQAYVWNYENTATVFATNSTERMRITSGGELLINTTSDAGDYKLQVNGNVYSTGNLTLNALAPYFELSGTQIGGKSYRIYTAYYTAGDFLIRNNTDATDMLLFSSTGNATFGGSIKTAAPSGGTAKPFKIGAAATVTPTSQNRTIEIEIDGTTYYLTAKTTND